MKTKGIPTLKKFDKSITPEQKASMGYLDWDDATLGLAVKAFARKMYETDVTGFKGVRTLSAVYVLIAISMEVNADSLTMSVSDFTHSKFPEQGSQTWKLTLEKDNTPKI